LTAWSFMGSASQIRY